LQFYVVVLFLFRVSAQGRIDEDGGELILMLGRFGDGYFGELFVL
jgi:hypothetical protein